MNVDEILILLLIAAGVGVAYLVMRSAARKGAREALRERDAARVEASTRHMPHDGR